MFDTTLINLFPVELSAYKHNLPSTLMDEEKKGAGCCCWSGGKGGKSFGVFLVVLGGFFLLQDMEIIPTALSIWPIALIGVGLWCLLGCK